MDANWAKATRNQFNHLRKGTDKGNLVLDILSYSKGSGRRTQFPFSCHLTFYQKKEEKVYHNFNSFKHEFTLQTNVDIDYIRHLAE